MQKFNEIIERTGIVILLYGKAGLGKTYLASTADNSVLFDFDNGLYRSESKPTNFVVVENYKQFLNDFDKGITADTIIIDTIDNMIQVYDIHITSANQKYKRNIMQKYGAILKEVREKTQILKKSGKNVIFIAHAKKRQIDDLTYFEPKITGSSSDDIPTLCDAIGYMDNSNDGVKVTFNSSQYNEGKNSANIPDFVIPRFKNALLGLGYFDCVINQMKDNLNNRQKTNADLRELLYSFRSRINECKDIESLELIGDEIKDDGMDKNLKTALRPIYAIKKKEFAIVPTQENKE